MIDNAFCDAGIYLLERLSRQSLWRLIHIIDSAQLLDKQLLQPVNAGSN